MISNTFGGGRSACATACTEVTKNMASVFSFHQVGEPGLTESPLPAKPEYRILRALDFHCNAWVVHQLFKISLWTVCEGNVDWPEGLMYTGQDLHHWATPHSYWELLYTPPCPYSEGKGGFQQPAASGEGTRHPFFSWPCTAQTRQWVSGLRHCSSLW